MKARRETKFFLNVKQTKAKSKRKTQQAKRQSRPACPGEDEKQGCVYIRVWVMQDRDAPKTFLATCRYGTTECLQVHTRWRCTLPSLAARKLGVHVLRKGTQQ